MYPLHSKVRVKRFTDDSDRDGALKGGEGAGHEITVPGTLAARRPEVREAGSKQLKLRRNREGTKRTCKSLLSA